MIDNLPSTIEVMQKWIALLVERDEKHRESVLKILEMIGGLADRMSELEGIRKNEMNSSLDLLDMRLKNLEGK